ncbi:flagellar M-ring protein FliF [Fodinibius roseus]|uniref:Flagellar M-ring protein n=1 Tax=Fodinibius roseus TaxID=1194090 RepID=A0A1M5HGX2_9BACT|nr:flagellar basal-body MS-ring/collar protein FliF [Fodinibius roseus]SHG15082.1 flagellar M-ring protein FliF [Fodinibius roseus]
MNSFTERFKEFVAPLSTAQRTMFAGLAIAIILIVGGLFYWSLRPSYTLLFGSIESETAQEIIQELDERAVDYKLENNGRSIYVEGNRVDQLRIELAPIGAPKSDMKGYELFDTKTLGMTDYMQQLNNRRALEGELSRSVNSLQQVESSRIHLVLPERSPFEQTSVSASASVLLVLQRGENLEKKHVDGITSLIAGSVEGLDAQGVTVIDQAGNRLTDNKDEGTSFASGDMQLKLEQKTENYLTERGQSMLDRVLGPGNSILRVSVEQNFDSLVRESNEVDPESRTLISEQQSEETHTREGSELVPMDEFTPVDDRGETAVTSTTEDEVTSRTRNYEVTEIKEVYKKAQGNISKISASVLLNQKQVLQENEEGQEVWMNEPYSEEEIEEFQEVLGSALGVQPERGDRITIKQVEFWNPDDMGPRGNLFEEPWPWSRIFRWGIILAALGAIIALLNSLRKQTISGEQGLLVGSPFGKNKQVYMSSGDDDQISGMSKDEFKKYIEEQDEDQPALEERKYNLEEIVNLVELKPTKAARVVRAMLVSNEDD